MKVEFKKLNGHLVYQEEGKPGEYLYIGHVLFPDSEGYYEEIDVGANNKKQAREIIKAAIEKDYEPGGKIKEIIEA